MTVSDHETELTALLKRAQRGGVILRSPDGHEFILAEIDDFDREIRLTRSNKRLMKLLDERARETRTINMAAAKARLRS